MVVEQQKNGTFPGDKSGKAGDFLPTKSIEIIF